jgi:hypothetical protein
VHKELKKGAEDYPVYVHRRSGEVRRPWTGFSGDRGLASPAKQSPIPYSGSFTEAYTVSSKGRAWLGRALLAGVGWQGLGWPRARRARGKRRWFRAPVRSSVRGGVRSTPEGDLLARVRAGDAGAAWRGAQGRARACSGAHRARQTCGGVLLPMFKSLLRSHTCESWQKSSADLFPAPMAISCL